MDKVCDFFLKHFKSQEEVDIVQERLNPELPKK